jgi:hypothetical protein
MVIPNARYAEFVADGCLPAVWLERNGHLSALDAQAADDSVILEDHPSPVPVNGHHALIRGLIKSDHGHTHAGRDPRRGHVFQAFAAVLDEGEAALTRASAFLRAHTHTGATAGRGSERRATRRPSGPPPALWSASRLSVRTP